MNPGRKLKALMLKFAQLVYDAIGKQHPRLFIMGCAILGAIACGALGWLIIKAGAPPAMLANSDSASSSPEPPAAPPLVKAPEEPKLSPPQPPEKETPVKQKSEGPNSPNITQTGQSNIAQVGNNNQAVITSKLPSRRLSASQREAMLPILSRHSGWKINLEAVLGDIESDQYALDFVALLREAGWDLGGRRGYSSSQWTRPAQGVEIHVKNQVTSLQGNPRLSALLEALSAAGIDFGNTINYNSGRAQGEDDIWLVIGQNR